MAKIQVLSEFLANQIAAGEVVQNPESVVKELVENSIDAGASTICVFLKKAGKTQIHILDDGCGMSKEDLELAPLRHTTSKLFTSEQLDEIRTFGFRGEALASISSVSLLEIQSRTEDAEYGWTLKAEPQKDFVIEPINMQVGTQIFVKNLFFNTPARRKFLKSDLVEFRKIDDSLKRLAIAHPDKRFILYDDDKLVFEVKPNDLENRIIDLFGKNYADKKLLKVEKTFSNGVKISGYIGQPQLAKTGAATQYLFLNRRTIFSKQLAYAVFLAFEHLISHNLKPFFVLNIEVDYQSVDVNVHPQKNEVRFDNEKFIFSCVKNAVEEALRLTNFIQPDIEPSFDQVEVNDKESNNTLLVNKETGEIISQKPDYSKQKNFYQDNSRKMFQSNPRKTFDKATSALVSAATDKLYATEKYVPQPKEHITEEFFPSNNIVDTSYDKKIDSMKFNVSSEELEKANIWQFHNKYIFLQVKDGLLAIDQHNAVERFLYEKIIDRLNSGAGSPQTLLFPIEIVVSEEQLETMQNITAELKRIGFDFELKNNSVIILATPSDLEISASEHTFLEIIDEYLYSETLRHSTKQEKIAATVACKSAIKAGQKLNLDEMRVIISRLFSCRMPHICPHGRPIIINYTMQEFDKQFGRI